MSEEVKVILDLSNDVQTLLDEQGIDLYQELQQELPSIHLQKQSDPEAPSGSRDLATIILATASLVTALTPVIIRILNQITPAHHAQTWIVEEIETRHPDGTTTIQRKRVLSSNESRSVELQADQQTSTNATISEEIKKTKDFMSQKRYAYLIGANGPQTERLDALKYAEKDAQRLAEALLTPHCAFTKAESTIAKSRQPTLDSLHSFVKQCEPSDLLLVHFSGHADQEGQLFLLCNDTDIDNYFSSAISIDAIKFYLDKCKARYKVLVLDCCRAGAAYPGAFKGDQDIQSSLQQTLKGSVNIILLACSHREKARELETLDGGAGFLSWALTTACTSRFEEVSQGNHSLSLADIRQWIPSLLQEVNSSLEPKDQLPEPIFVIETRGGDDREIWLTEQHRAHTSKFVPDELTRKQYLESVFKRYSSVTLPLGPTESFSLHAVFQPLELRRDPLAAEDLDRKKRRLLLGERLEDEKDADRFYSQLNEKERTEEKQQPVIAENGEDLLIKSPQRRIVILGGPGTGKTTMLKHITGCRAKEALIDPNAPLPIFLSLADLARSKRPCRLSSRSRRRAGY